MVSAVVVVVVVTVDCIRSKLKITPDPLFLEEMTRAAFLKCWCRNVDTLTLLSQGTDGSKHGRVAKPHDERAGRGVIGICIFLPPSCVLVAPADQQ